MAALYIETPATAQPVTLDEAKTFLRVSITDDDVLIQTLIECATEAAESFTNRSFCTKGFRMSLDSFPYFVDTVMSQNAYPPSYYSLPRYSTTLWNYSQMIKLFRPRLQAIQRISYLSANDSQWHDLVQAPPLWYPGTVVSVNDLRMDNNANVQKCTQAGTTDSNPPVWNKTLNGTTTEANPDPEGEGTGPVIWTNQGPLNAAISGGNSQFGLFITDTDSEPARIFPGPPGFFWPPVLYVPNAVQIHYTAGYADDGSVTGNGPGQMPGRVKIAILQTVAHWYENREPVVPGSVNELPQHCQMLLWSLRVMDMQPTRG
jgi:hypothetical protein